MTGVVIKTKINGFPVQINIDKEDLNGAVPEWITSGLLNATVTELKANGVEPDAYTPKADSSSSGGGSKWAGAKKESWTCPEHGDKYIKTSFKGGKSFCSGFVELDESRDDGGRPSWAKDEPSEYQGKWKWFCAHKE